MHSSEYAAGGTRVVVLDEARGDPTVPKRRFPKRLREEPTRVRVTGPLDQDQPGELELREAERHAIPRFGGTDPSATPEGDLSVR